MSVTGIIRDPDIYSAITEKLGRLIARLILGKTMHVQTRSYATVEQVYALRIIISLVMDHSADLSQHISVFCIVLLDQSLGAARIAEYEVTERGLVSNTKLEQLSSKHGSKVQIDKKISSSIVNAQMCPGEEWPIPKADLICCSNTFIYFNDKSQAYIINLYAFSLNPSSLLVVGGPESVGRDQEYKAEARIPLIYEKTNKQSCHSIRLVAQLVRRNSNLHWSAISPMVTRMIASTQHIRLLKKLIILHDHCALVLDKYPSMVEVVLDVSKYCQMTEERLTTSTSTCLAELQDRARELIQQVHAKNASSSSRSINIDNLDNSIDIHAVPMALARRNMTVNYSDPKESTCIVRDQYQIPGQEYISFSHDIRQKKRELYANQVYQHVSMARLDQRVEESGPANDELQRITEHPKSLNEELQASLLELGAMIEELTALNQHFCVKNKR